MSAPNLLYTEHEEELRASLRSLLEDRCPQSAVLARCETDEPYDVDLWRALASDVGVAGLHVPESHGGHGASFHELAIVAEELGRSLAPVPFLGSAVLATTAMLASEGEAALTSVASGERTAALAVPLTSAAGDPFPGSVKAEGDALTGTVTSVVDAPYADLLVVPAVDADGAALYVVEAGATQRERVAPFDLTRALGDVTFAGTAGERIGSGQVAEDAVAIALYVGAAMLASEQLGQAERCLEMTVEHLKNRYQFGRPIGSFQGLKHRLAELWVSITQARAVARYAAACVSTPDQSDTAIGVAVAAAHCSALAVHAADECVQMHGGMGFTWEHPAHLYLKRAKSSSLALGTADRHRAALAELVDLPGP